ncbi:cyclophilin-like fold protein [Burkholderia territorii]|uniref:cyclophilin-like fold protein n=1 Tax=Burkholderia territorii TaxID=1503055 RepID=UPI000AC40AB1|nr:cyclophilin-like fold protein [Burkholderia territorii]
MKIKSVAAAALCMNLMHAYAVPPGVAAGPNANTEVKRRIWMAVGERRFSITLADTEAARAFAAQLPLTLDMSDLNGNEKHAKLPKALPARDSQPGTIRVGDLMLWRADTLVVFYLTFDSPYSYTRLGSIDQPASLPDVLGRGMVRIVFTR